MSNEAEVIPLYIAVEKALTEIPPFPGYVDNSARSDWVKCETKWMYSFLRSIAPGAPSVHLHAGGSFAKGLESARKAFWEERKEVGEAKRIGLQELIKAYGAFIAPPTKQGDKSLENVIRAFDSYMRQYPLDTDPIKPYKTDSGKYMIEFTFSLPTEVRRPFCDACLLIQTSDAINCKGCGKPLDPILYTGRSDMIGVLYDSLWVTDEKTTSQLGEQWANQWKLDSQMTGYIAAARKHGFNAVAALIRGVGLLKTKISHAEAQVYRGQWEIDRWWEELHKNLRRMVHAYCNLDFALALDKHSCNAYGGCPFVPFCDSQNPKQWANQYRIRRWDPLAKDFGEKLLENPAIKEVPGDDLVIDLKDLM